MAKHSIEQLKEKFSLNMNVRESQVFTVSLNHLSILNSLYQKIYTLFSAKKLTSEM